MKLTSLTLQGFKSFAGRTTLELPPGIAAVVGPNGSGKSNIADALRWVLGEQSVKLLRGTRLEDVIFAGSDRKRPVGMAEVSITFDNQSGRIPVDYSEVTVTRRVYRSGESDFLINQTPSRLRDIHELFMDTGIGRGSLALIGQGEVDAILSARPEDRRAFLEEVAGITRYRARKQEALRKLQQTEENLVRVRDIIREIESRLDPLSRQAELAREYEAVRERLGRIEITLLLQDYRTAKEAYEENQRSARLVEAQRKGARDRLQTLHAKGKELSERLDALDEEMEAKRTEAEAAKEAEVAAKHRGERARDRLDRVDRDEDEGRRRLGAARERIHRLEHEQGEVEIALKRARESLGAKEAQLEDLEKGGAEGRKELEAGESQLRKHRKEIGDLRERIVSKQARIESLGRELDNRADEERAQRERLHRLSEGIAKAEERLKSEEADKARIDSDYEKASESLRELEERLASVRQKREDAENRLSESRRRWQDLSARRQALADMEESREGYHRGVRSVLAAAAKRGWGLLGAVAELLTVPAEYETAVEVALGGAQQFVVARTGEDAKEAIEYLKEKRSGRATFLPLDTLRPRRLPQDEKRRLEGLPGVIGILSDLVRLPDDCRPVADYLLGRVLLTKDLDAAVRVARDNRSLSRVVTVDGDVLIPGGAMTGGSRPGRSEGLIARSRQLEELAEAIRKEEERASLVREDLALLDQEVEEVRRRRTQVEGERRRLELERLSADRDVKETRAHLARLKEERNEADAFLKRLGERREKAVWERNLLEEELEEASKRKEALENEISAMEKELSQKRETHEAFRRDLERVRVEIAGLIQAVDERERDAKRVAGEIEEATAQMARENERLAALSDERRKAREEIGRAELMLEREGERRRKALEELEALKAERRAVREDTDAVSQKTEEAQALFDEIQEEYARVRVESERIEVELEGINQALAERGVDPMQASFEDEEDRDVTALRAEAKSLKRRIQALGPVNVASIDEYEAVKERHRFLDEQRVDLEEAKSQLEEVISRIDRESKDKLNAVFQEVRRAFADVFVRLFRGGKADLAFVDPDNPLESGVDIFVQPPGKKMQNLLALSGGERALAAIALLFAILTVRPSPFCVLDEIDAALDEHNLERFCGLLREYAQKTQFLIITHRQATMETADSLFGVTMEESGVSKLVSLKLDDAKSA